MMGERDVGGSRRWRAMADAMANDHRMRQKQLLRRTIEATRENSQMRERLTALEAESAARDKELLAALAAEKERAQQMDEEALKRKQLGATLK